MKMEASTGREVTDSSKCPAVERGRAQSPLPQEPALPTPGPHTPAGLNQSVVLSHGHARKQTPRLPTIGFLLPTALIVHSVPEGQDVAVCWAPGPTQDGQSILGRAVPTQ